MTPCQSRTFPPQRDGSRLEIVQPSRVATNRAPGGRKEGRNRDCEGVLGRFPLKNARGAEPDRPVGKFQPQMNLASHALRVPDQAVAPVGC